MDSRNAGKGNNCNGRKILIVKTSSLGDIVHTFPAVHALCNEMNCKCDWVIEPQFAGMLEFLPCVDRAIVFNKKKFEEFFGFLPAFFSFCKEVRREKYVAVLDFQGLMRNAILGWLAKYDRFAGFCQPKEFLSKLLYTETYPVKHNDMEEHAVLKNNRMVMQFNHRLKLNFNYTLPCIERYAAEVQEMPGCQTPKQYFAVVPGARWESKEWSTEFFSECIDKIHGKYPKFNFVMVGGKNDVNKAEDIIKMLNDNAAARVYNLCGKTSLQQLTEILRNSAICLTNDSGPMHIAAAVDTPVIALFGPTSPELTGPYTDKKIVLQPKNIACLKCFRRHCDDMKCHAGISADDVLSATEKFLNKERI